MASETLIHYCRIKLGIDVEEALLDAAMERVEQYAWRAPESVKRLAVRAMVAWCLDVKPGIHSKTKNTPGLDETTTFFSTMGHGALRLSGAAEILQAWKSFTVLPIK